MNIDDTIGTLMRIRQAIERGIPQTISRPDRLIAALNELYVQSVENREFDELFEYHNAGLLRVSHKYSHQQVDTKSVLSIVKRMIDYALDYLEEVKTFAEGGAGGPQADREPL